MFGFPEFPNVPPLPGVPSLPRFVSKLPQVANLQGTIDGLGMSVSSITGSLFGGSVLSGHGLINGTKVVSQLSGIGGGIGSYLIDTAQSFAGSFGSVFDPPNFDGGEGFLDSDDSSVSQSSQLQWGIFDKDGNAAIVGDNVVSVEFARNRHISDYPVEPDSFASYNKVAIPYDFRIIFSIGGTSDDRSDFLQSVDAVVQSLDVYDAVTPDATYSSANAVHYDYTRKAQRGVVLLQVNVYFEEIREKATSTFTQTDPDTGASQQVPAVTAPKDPTATSIFNAGPVQALPPTNFQQSILQSAPENQLRSFQ